MKQSKNKLDHILNQLSTIQLIVLYYFLAVVSAFIFLSLPFFKNEGAQLSFLDTLFLAVSTISVTGLSTVDLAETYNMAGIVLVQALFQVGSLGVMVISTSILLFRRKKISLKQRQLIMVDMNQPKLSGTVRLIRNTIFTIFGIQLIGGFILAAYFSFTSLFEGWQSLLHGMFVAFSAVANAGVDITGNSLTMFSTDYFVQAVVMILIAIGGLGFPVLLEIKEFIYYKRNAPKALPFRFSLFSKVAVSSFVLLFFLGAAAIWLLESGNYFKDMGYTESAFFAMFYSVTTRNAGLITTPINHFSEATLLLFSLLMFIGASPSSVGGGIRTTTLTIVLLYLSSFIRGHYHVTIFGRRIDEEDVKKSVSVVILSITLCFISVMILTITEEHSLLSLIVEVASAFGTTGLSLGITSSLTTIGRIVIIVLMFIGRVGMLYILMLMIPKHSDERNYAYPTEKIIIG